MAARRVNYGKVPTRDDEVDYGYDHQEADGDYRNSPDAVLVNAQLAALNNQNKFMRRAIIVAFVLVIIVLFSSSEQASMLATAVIKSLNTTTTSASSLTPGGSVPPPTADTNVNTNDSTSAVSMTAEGATTTATSTAPVATATTPAPITTATVTTTAAPAPAVLATTTTPPPVSDKAEQCTPDQLKKIEQQLPSNPSCFGHQWDNGCPITKETNCPEPKWLFDYYNTKISPEQEATPFVAIDVGCGTATRALVTLKMGTRDSAIVDLPTWSKALGAEAAPTCPMEPLLQMIAPAAATKRVGTLHCIEPLPITYEAVKKASESTKLNQMGLVLHQLAITDKDGSQDFPIVDVGSDSHQKVHVGSKDVGVHSCTGLADATKKEKCKAVQAMTLDSFVEKNIPKANNNNINALIIVAGTFEFEVLAGGKSALSRVEYLEFAFNWKYGWQKPDHTIPAAVDMLNGIGFTCYWAGKKKLWRITGCPLPLYQTAKFWSNIACVNRKLAPGLAAEMEKFFLETIK
jgi:FkbM family methyltransferase